MEYRINIKDVIDYCFCPHYYFLKKNDPKNYNMKELYDVSLHKCFYEYLLALQTDTLYSRIDTLKYRWGKEWIKPKKNSEIICTPTASHRDTYNQKRKTGIEALITFDKLMDEPQFPIIINKPYEIHVSNNLILCGTWEYVREVTNDDNSKSIQIIKFKTEHDRFITNIASNHDLGLTAASMAFLNTFNVDSVELIYADIYKKKLISTIRGQSDYDLLKQTVIDTFKCIKNDIKIISPDKKCFHCEYRNECEKILNLKIKE